MLRTLRATAGRLSAERGAGLAAMLAYHLLLSVLPFLLLAMFVTGRLLESDAFARNLAHDLAGIFTGTSEASLRATLQDVRRASGAAGLLALVGAVWTASSLWGAVDLAFARLYRRAPRDWLAQRRFGLAMLGVTVLLVGATLLVPSLQSVLARGAARLPLGLDELGRGAFVLALAVALGVLAALLCVVYAVTPVPRPAWSAVWPGALLATAAIALIDAAFPLYLSLADTTRFGAAAGLLFVVLLWFHAVSLALLAGAALNAVRLEAGA